MFTDLKPGDEIAVEPGDYCSPPLIRRVKTVTPSGQIVLNNGWRFNKDGRERGRPATPCSIRRFLIPVTDEIREVVDHHRLIEQLKVKLKNWQELPVATLKQIHAILTQVTV